MPSTPSSVPIATPGTPGRAPSSREVRVDFFRGVAMFIIFIAHMPGNAWALWIPARFGASDGAEMFVFCSGYASAMAFGSVFAQRGFGIGVARIAYRVWQVYWAHIGLFLAVATVCVIGTHFLDNRNYVAMLNLYKFFDNSQAGLLHLLTLTYIPNFFDILPMYIVVLVLVPVMVALQRVHTGVFVAGALAIWLAAPHLQLPAEWWSQRHWFFNPFGWQLVFFTGFAFGARWIKPPKPNPRLFWGCVAFVLVLVPICWFRLHREVELFGDIRALLTGDNLQWGLKKTNFGILRWLHFLALAYIMYCIFSTREHWLRSRWARPVVQVGQQSLAVFLFSMVLAWIGAMVLDSIGRSSWSVPLVNLSAFCLIYCVARLAGWIKSSPWRVRRDATRTTVPAAESASAVAAPTPPRGDASVPGLPA